MKKYAVVVGAEMPTIPLAFFDNFHEARIFYINNLSIFKNKRFKIWVKRFEEIKHLF